MSWCETCQADTTTVVIGDPENADLWCEDCLARQTQEDADDE